MYLSVGTAWGPQSLSNPLLLHRVMEGHTSVSSLPFQLRSGPHHLTSRPPYLLKSPSLFYPQTHLCEPASCGSTFLFRGLQDIPEARKLVYRLPSLSFKEVHVTQSTISPQINQSCITTQTPYGCHTETEGGDPVLALK